MKLGGITPEMLKALQPWRLGGARKRELAVTYYRSKNIDVLIRRLREHRHPSGRPLGYHTIAQRLMDDGVRTSTGSAKWTADHVRKVHLMLQAARAKAGAA